MKYVIPSLLSSFILTACAVPSTSPHGGGHTTRGEHASTLTLEDRSSEEEIAFAILNKGDVFTDYGISHTKEMHLIIVRDDLRYFRHLHPERDAENVWRVPFGAPAGGKYRLYADFIESNQSAHTIRFYRSYKGKSDESGISKNFESVKIVDGYRIEMQPTVSGNETAFSYVITDDQGQSPILEEYLGALGHSVLLSLSGDFIHTHPNGGIGTPVFETTNLTEDFYRIFTQFQIEGKVMTVEFDWE